LVVLIPPPEEIESGIARLDGKVIGKNYYSPYNAN